MKTTTKAQEELETAKRNVRFLLENPTLTAEFKGLVYWAMEVERR